MFLKKDDVTIVFDKKMTTGNGLVVGCEILSREVKSSGREMVLSTMTKGIEMDINKYHAIMGHPSFDSTKLTAEYHGIKLTGIAKPCDDCALSKSRQKNLKKETTERSTTPGERLYIDQSTIKQRSYGGSECWFLIVDDCTDFWWSTFLKDEQNSYLLSLIKDLHQAKSSVTVKYIRCDNAGENTALEKLCLKEGMGIQFEYTSPYSTIEWKGRKEVCNPIPEMPIHAKQYQTQH
jgi:hypothetical protein